MGSCMSYSNVSKVSSDPKITPLLKHPFFIGGVESDQLELRWNDTKKIDEIYCKVCDKEWPGDSCSCHDLFQITPILLSEVRLRLSIKHT